MQIFPSLFSSKKSDLASNILNQSSAVTKAYSGFQNAQLNKGFGNYILSAQKKIENKFSEISEKSDSPFLAQIKTEKAIHDLIDAQKALSSQTSLVKRSDTAVRKQGEEKSNTKLKTAAEALEDLENDEAESQDEGIVNSFLSPYNFSVASPELQLANMPVRCTSNEVNLLIEKAEKEGLPTNVLRALKELSKLPGGATIEKLMEAALNSIEKSGKALTKKQEQDLLGLSQKLQTADIPAEKIFEVLKNGSPDIILAQVSQLMGNKESVTITKDEIRALTQQLRLSPDTEKQVTAIFSKANSLTLTKESFDTVIAPALKEVTDLATSKSKIEEILAPLLLEIEKIAKQREQFELSTQRQEDKNTSHTKTIMKDSVLEKVLVTLENPTKSSTFVENEELEKGRLSTQNILNGKVTEKEKVELQGNIQKGKSTTGASNENRAENPSVEQGSLEKASTENSGDLKKTQSFSDTLKEANTLSSTKQEGEKQASQQQSDTSKNLFNYFTQTQTNSPQNIQNIQGIKSETAPAYVQVEKALEAGIKSNVTKLEVQLNPVELGALTIMLTSKAGEVSAVIQPEKAETAQQIAMQVQAIKNELESQGIKLEKIEVQLKSSDSQEFAHSQNEQFTGNEGQAQYDEYTARSHELTRLRALGRSINEGELIDLSQLTSEEITMAQSLQDDTYYLNSMQSSHINIRA